jgi:hypothetical protein
VLPLIVHGKKPEPEPEIKSNPPVEVAPVIVTPVATNEVAVTRTNAVSATIRNIISTRTQTQAVATSASAMTTNAVASEPVSDSSRTKMLWVGGGVLVGAATVGIGFMLLRLRRKTHASLITRSLDREKDRL